MLVRRIEECAEFVAGDGTLLREYLHPDKTSLELRYSLAHATVHRGQTSLAHRLRHSEVYCVLEGEGELRIDGEYRRVSAGDVAYIPPGSVQCIRNVGEGALKFLCIVDPAWRPECEELGDLH
jgi:mannose-6-phosphate isomerase-like protein (cupin superfamily)